MALRDVPLPDAPEGEALPGVSVAEASAQLGVSIHAVRRLVRAGKLRTVRLSRPQGWVVRVLLEDGHVAPRSAPPPSAPGSALPPPRSATSHVAPPSATSAPPADAELVAVLKAEVDDLRRRLDFSEHAQAELRRLLAAALQQRALGAGTAAEEKLAQGCAHAPWWQRLLWWRRPGPPA
jgi:hypothetical protein